jgi:arsenate reductase-like glutaredoxin family protein
MLNKTVKTILLSILLFSVVGCKVFQSGGKISSREQTARNRIENVETLITSNVVEKLDRISSISYGIEYTLSIDPNPSQESLIARDLNIRVLSLAGSPTLDEIKNMKQMVDDLTSELSSERNRGIRALEAKDQEIMFLQTHAKFLQEAKDSEIRRYIKLAQDTAAKADIIQSQLDKMNTFMGLGAVVYGLKRFITRMAWFFGIGSILYLILRFASMSNPIASSIFSIFDQIMSWFVHLIRALAPRALEVAGQTSKLAFEKYKKAMSKMVDGIQTLKDRQKANGDPNKKYTLDEVLEEFSKIMNEEEKRMVDDIKNSIKY